MARPRKLSTEAQAFIVQRLAMWETPSEVVDAVADRFGVVITRQAVEAYDPTSYAGRKMTRWRALFDRCRSAYVEELNEIPIAHKAYRLQRLQRLLSAAETMKNLALAREVLEQAAKEMGKMYERPEREGGLFEGAVFEMRAPARQPTAEKPARR